MKKSIYNTEIEVSDNRFLLYNSLKDRYLILTANLRKIWMSEDPDGELIRYPDFAEQLSSNGFIVGEEVNELDVLLDKINRSDGKKSRYILIVNPTMSCNFKCWYCYETHPRYSKMTPEVLAGTQKFIEQTVVGNQELKRFNLSFFGGEPLLYFKDIVTPLMEFTDKLCRENNIASRYSFTTNGYLITEEIIRFLAPFYPDFQITLDGNRQDHNKTRFSGKNIGSYDRILENVKSLLKNKLSVSLRINFTGENHLGLSDIISDLQGITPEMNKYLRIDFQQVWQDVDKDNLIDEKIKQKINDFKQAGFFSLYGNRNRIKNQCYADKVNGAVINYNGDVFRCTARDFEKTPRDGYLHRDGYIVWENESDKKRRESIMRNEPCRRCRIAPLCGGGCSQRSYESNGNEYCLNNHDEQKKDKLVLKRFENLYINNKQ